MGKHRLKTLGLIFAAALCLTAFIASSARANWRVLGADIKANAALTVSTHENTVLLVPSLSLEITCTTVASDASSPLTLLVGTNVAGTLAYSGCTTKAKGVSQPNCNPINQPIKVGLKGHLVLIGTKNLILFEPTTAGGKLTTIEFDDICALVATTDLTGKLLFECLKPELLASDCSTEETSHLLRQQAREEDMLKFGVRGASLDGVVKTELTTQKTEKWSGIV